VDALYGSEVYLIGVGTRNGPTLEGFIEKKNKLNNKKKKKKKKKERRKEKKHTHENTSLASWMHH